MKKYKDFSKKELEDIFQFFRWFLVNYALKKIHVDDLTYNRLLRILTLIGRLEEEIVLLENEGWIEGIEETLDIKSK